MSDHRRTDSSRIDGQPGDCRQHRAGRRRPRVSRHGREGGTAEPDSRGRALRHGGGRVLPAAVRGILARGQPPGAVPDLSHADLRRMERVDDGQRLARSGMARGVPAVGAADVDATATAMRRRRRMARRRPATTRSPPQANASRGSTSATGHYSHVASGLARRRLLLEVPHADQLRRQRAASERHDRRRVRPRARCAWT